MVKLYKIFFIAGILNLVVGFILEAIYFFYLKDLYWILLIVPPPGSINWARLVPSLGIIFLGIGIACIIAGIWLFLRVDVENLRKSIESKG